MTPHRDARRSTPTPCLVTPGIAVSAEDVGTLRDFLDAAVGAAVDVVQVRERGLPARQLLDLVAAAVRRSRGTRTRVVVNDRVDVALAAAADGVHLGGRSMTPGDVRRMTPDGFIIGCSVHSADEARRLAQSAHIDYFIAGTVFATPSKPGAHLLGLDGLSAVVEAVSVPVLAIGGVDLSRAAAVAATGAAGFAAIGLFATAGASGLLRVVDEARRLFDPTGAVS